MEEGKKQNSSASMEANYLCHEEQFNKKHSSSMLKILVDRTLKGVGEEHPWQEFPHTIDTNTKQNIDSS